MKTEIKEHIRTDVDSTTIMEKPRKLFNKNFVLLWQGQFVSRLGSQVYVYTMILWLTYTFNSPTLVGMLGMLSSIPIVLLSVIGGAAADQFSRKKIIVSADSLNGIFVIGLAALFFLIPDSYEDKNNLILYGMFTIAILNAILMAFFGPAIDASIPDIVPKDTIEQANSLGQMSNQLAQFFGMGAGAGLLSVLGAPILVLIDGITYIFSAISESFIKIPQQIPDKAKTVEDQITKFKEDIKEGLAFIWKKKGLKRLVFFSIFSNFFMTAVAVLIPFYVKDHLRVAEYWYGILLISYGIGTLIGYAFVGISRMKGKTRGKFMIAFFLFEGIGYIILGLLKGPLFAAGIMIIGGAFHGFILVNITTLMQLTTPSQIRGRVFGVLTTLSGSIVPLGMGLSGVVAELLGGNLAIVYIASGVLTILLTFILSSNKHFREFISYQTEKELEDTGFRYNIRIIDTEEIKMINKLKYKELL